MVIYIKTKTDETIATIYVIYDGNVVDVYPEVNILEYTKLLKNSDKDVELSNDISRVSLLREWFHDSYMRNRVYGPNIEHEVTKEITRQLNDIVYKHELVVIQ